MSKPEYMDLYAKLIGKPGHSWGSTEITGFYMFLERVPVKGGNANGVC